MMQGGSEVGSVMGFLEYERLNHVGSDEVRLKRSDSKRKMPSVAQPQRMLCLTSPSLA